MSEQIAVQTQTVQDAKGPQSMRARFAQNTLGGQMGGDAFAMIFAQMMGGGEGESLMDTLLSQLAENGQMPEDEQQNQFGAGMAAEFLMAQPNLVAMLAQSQPQTLGQLAQANSGMPLPTGINQSLNQLLNQPTTQSAQTMQQVAETLVQGVTEQTGDTETGVSKEFYQMLANAWKTESGQTQGSREGQLEFESAVRQVRETLSQKPKEQQTETLNLNGIGGAVQAKDFVPQAVSTKQAEALPEAQEIYEQLKSGILEQTAKGKNEFVVKLKPEGLGEITVHLSESDNKISLSIVTSSAHVAKLIADDIASLQNALRPLHAEVQQIVTPAGHTQQYTDGQATFAQQGFDGRGHQQQNQESQHPRYYRGGGVDEEFVAAQQAVLDESALNAYI